VSSAATIGCGRRFGGDWQVPWSSACVLPPTHPPRRLVSPPGRALSTYLLVIDKECRPRHLYYRATCTSAVFRHPSPFVSPFFTGVLRVSLCSRRFPPRRHWSSLLARLGSVFRTSRASIDEATDGDHQVDCRSGAVVPYQRHSASAKWLLPRRVLPFPPRPPTYPHRVSVFCALSAHRAAHHCCSGGNALHHVTEPGCVGRLRLTSEAPHLHFRLPFEPRDERHRWCSI